MFPWSLGFHIDIENPPSDTSTVQTDAHDRPRNDVIRQVVGNEVVEGPVDGWDVGQDPTDPLVGLGLFAQASARRRSSA